MTHNIKINHRFVEDILNGNKRFEIRNNDRAYQKGDRVRFTVVDDDGVPYSEVRYIEGHGLKNLIPKDEVRKIKSMIFEITFVISGWGLKNGYVAFGIKEAQDE